MDILLSNSGDEPIYAQIVRQIKGAILSGALEGGAALPSIRALASSLKISAITTKRAYEELEREGYIVAQMGKGCFVRAPNLEMLREQRLRVAEEKLEHAAKAAKAAEISRDDFLELAALLFEEE